VKRRKGRRSLANFENLPVTTQVYELSAEERTCPGCGVVRQESGARRVGRSSTFLATSNASTMCVRNMPA